MKNKYYTFFLFVWMLIPILALGFIIVGVNGSMQHIDTWQDVYYLPDDLDRSCLLFGTSFFFLSITVPFLLTAMKKVSVGPGVNIGRLKGWLYGLTVMWAALIVLGLGMLLSTYYVNTFFQLDYGPGALSWYLFFQGCILILLGFLMCPLLIFYQQPRRERS
ncbi:MAG: hypothetical protein AB7D40_05855 [Bacteroidales bacterium]